MTARVSTFEMAHDRTGQPVVETHRKCAIWVPKHVLVMKAWASKLETKHFVIERGQPVRKPWRTSQVMSNQCRTRWTWTSEFQGYHILLTRFENWLTESKTTQIDMLLNKIYEKQSLQPIQCGVKADDSGSGQRRASCLNVLRRTPRRSAKHAYRSGGEGIVYCTCGHLLTETVANRRFIVYTMTFFQFQNT